MSRKTKVEIVIAVVVFTVVGFLHDQAIATVLKLAGRGPNCGWGQSMTVIKDTEHQMEKVKFITERSRLVEKGDQGLELWETPHGRFWVPSASSKEIMYDLGEQERGIYTWNGNGVKPGDVVLDCGANIGAYTRVALKAGASKVIAIEPGPENIECLRRNFKSEIGEGKVVIYPKGVWDKDDVLPLHIDPKNSAGDSFVIQREGSHTINLPLTTIDKMVAELQLDRVDYIKMDIEGAERKAIAGARETLARWKPRMALCVYHLMDDPQAIPAAVRAAYEKYNYRCGPCISSEAYIKPEVFFFSAD
jgi:FkbM family methyltransferase